MIIDDLMEYDPFLKSVVEKKNMASFNFRTTSLCNMECAYCYQHKKRPTYINKNHIPIFKEALYHIMKERKDRGIEYFIHGLFIGGEISLNKINMDMVKAIEDVLNRLGNHEWLWLDIVSNFYNLDDDLLDFISYLNKKGYLEFLRTSLDFSKEIHDKHRLSKSHKGTWDIIVSNIKKVQNLGYKVQTNSVLTYDIILNYEPEDIIDMIQKIPADFVKVTLDYEIYYKNNLNVDRIKYFVNTILKWQANDMIYRLNNGLQNKYITFNLKLDNLPLILFHHNRFKCDMIECYTFEAKNEKDLVIGKCHNWTYNADNELNSLFQVFDSEFDDIKDISKKSILNKTIPESYPCKNCTLRGMCEECCLLHNQKIECNPIKREIGKLLRHAYGIIMSSENFYEIWKYYRNKVDGTTQEMNSLIKNEAFWKELIHVRVLKYYKED